MSFKSQPLSSQTPVPILRARGDPPGRTPDPIAWAQAVGRQGPRRGHGWEGGGEDGPAVDRLLAAEDK